MDLNATLFGQMITFALFIWFTMKFVWPPMTKALEDRQKKIADGIQAGERGHQELQLAQKRAVEVIKEAKDEAQARLDKVQRQMDKMMDDTKQAAEAERKRIVAAATAEGEQVKVRLQEALKNETVAIALELSEKILERSVDEGAKKALVEDMIANL